MNVVRWTVTGFVAAALAAGTSAAAPLGVTSARLTVDSEAVSLIPTTCTLDAAAADSYVSESAVLANFGTAPTLEVGSLPLLNRRSFAQFDLGSCGIPANALVTAASLRLFMTAAPTASRTYTARRVTSAWTETGITWANQPFVALVETATAATGTSPNVWLTWDVTTDVQAFVQGTANHGWRIGDALEGAIAEQRAVFSSAEHEAGAQRPVLTISYFR